MVCALVLEAVDAFKQIGLPSVIVFGRKGTEHHNTDGSVWQHGVIGDIVASRSIVGGRNIGLGQVDRFSTCVEVGQGSHSSSALVSTGRFQQGRRGVGAVSDIRGDNLQLVIDAVGKVRGGTVGGPV